MYVLSKKRIPACFVTSMNQKSFLLDDNVQFTHNSVNDMQYQFIHILNANSQFVRYVYTVKDSCYYFYYNESDVQMQFPALCIHATDVTKILRNCNLLNIPSNLKYTLTLILLENEQFTLGFKNDWQLDQFFQKLQTLINKQTYSLIDQELLHYQIIINPQYAKQIQNISLTESFENNLLKLKQQIQTFNSSYGIVGNGSNSRIGGNEEEIMSILNNSWNLFITYLSAKRVVLQRSFKSMFQSRSSALLSTIKIQELKIASTEISLLKQYESFVKRVTEIAQIIVNNSNIPAKLEEFNKQIRHMRGRLTWLNNGSELTFYFFENVLYFVGTDFNKEMKFLDFFNDILQLDITNESLVLRVPVACLIKYKGYKVLAISPPVINEGKEYALSRMRLTSQESEKKFQTCMSIMNVVKECLNLRGQNLGKTTNSVEHGKQKFMPLFFDSTEEFCQLEPQPFQMFFDILSGMFPDNEIQLQVKNNMFFLMKCPDFLPVASLDNNNNNSNNNNKTTFPLSTQLLFSRFIANSEQFFRKINKNQAFNSQREIDSCIANLLRDFENLNEIVYESQTLRLAFRKHGVNMRLLGTVANLTSQPYIKLLCVIEMIARISKNLLNKYMQEIHSEIAQFFQTSNIQKQTISLGQTQGLGISQPVSSTVSPKLTAVQSPAKKSQEILQDHFGMKQGEFNRAAADMLNMVLFRNRQESPIFYGSILPQHLFQRYAYTEKVEFHQLPEKVLLNALSHNLGVRVSRPVPHSNSSSHLMTNSNLLDVDNDLLTSDAFHALDIQYIQPKHTLYQYRSLNVNFIDQKQETTGSQWQQQTQSQGNQPIKVNNNDNEQFNAQAHSNIFAKGNIDVNPQTHSHKGKDPLRERQAILEMKMHNLPSEQQKLEVQIELVDIILKQKGFTTEYDIYMDMIQQLTGGDQDHPIFVKVYYQLLQLSIINYKRYQQQMQQQQQQLQQVRGQGQADSQIMLSQIRQFFERLEESYNNTFTDSGHVCPVLALKLYAELLIELKALEEACRLLLNSELLAMKSIGEVHELTAQILQDLSNIYSSTGEVIDQIELSLLLSNWKESEPQALSQMMKEEQQNESKLSRHIKDDYKAFQYQYKVCEIYEVLMKKTSSDNGQGLISNELRYNDLLVESKILLIQRAFKVSKIQLAFEQAEETMRFLKQRYSFEQRETKTRHIFNVFINLVDLALFKFQNQERIVEPLKDELELYFEMTTSFFVEHSNLLLREHIQKVFHAILHKAYFKTFSGDEKETFQLVCNAFYSNVKKNYQADVLANYQAYMKTILLKTQARNQTLSSYFIRFLHLILQQFFSLSREDLLMNYFETLLQVSDKHFQDNINDLDFVLILLGQQYILKAITPKMMD